MKKQLNVGLIDEETTKNLEKAKYKMQFQLGRKVNNDDLLNKLSLLYLKDGMAVEDKKLF